MSRRSFIINFLALPFKKLLNMYETILRRELCLVFNRSKETVFHRTRNCADESTYESTDKKRQQ